MPAVTIDPPPPQGDETTTQLDVMLRGEPYLAVDPYLNRLRNLAQVHVAKFNAESDGDKRMALLDGVAGMPPREGRKVYICTPFMFEYGFNLSFGDQVYLGPGCTLIDVTRIQLGDRTMVGANCSFYTPGHPTSPEARNGMHGPEWASEIIIGDDCWIGGSVVIVGPCKIGNGVTIGAGSVVTKDIPDRTIAVGNPCKVIKKINADGSTERVARA